MILDVWNTLNEISSKLEKFIESNYDNPFFWLILATVLFLIATTFIAKQANK